MSWTINIEYTMNKLIRVINKVVRHTDWYNNDYWNGVTKFWYNVRFNTDVVNLGSGAAVHAFSYENADCKGCNWALAPQSLVHDFNILKNYFSYIREGGVVIITICPFSCLKSEYGKEHNFKYYTILHPATIIDFDDNERTKALLVKNNPFKEMPVHCIKCTAKEIARKTKRIVFPKSNKPSLKMTADAMFNGWKRQFGISDINAELSEKHLNEQRSRRETLDEIISFCKERDLNPVVVIPPMHGSLTAYFTSAFIDHYVNRFLEGIDAPIYNSMYSDDIMTDEDFSSALFLSHEGAKKYTAILIERLIKDKVMNVKKLQTGGVIQESS